MYSDEVQEILDEKSLTHGDRVSIETRENTEKGVLMPRAEQGNNDCLVIKLESGYNIGINIHNIEKIQKLEKKSKEPAKEMQKEKLRYDEDKPDILILHTGGTIASRVSYEEGGVTPAFEPEDLLDMYPELFEEANIESEVVAQMFSEDIEVEHWQEIAEKVAENRDKDGIIISHGTDTMHFSAAALSFMLQGIDIPIVLVGSQRSSDRPSSDAAMNLISAAEFVKEGVPGVFICMHANSSDDRAAVHLGTRARKMHTSRRDAFKSIGRKPVAEVDYEKGEVEIVEPPSYERKEEFELEERMEKDVDYMKVVPGMEKLDLERYKSSEGLLIEGTGLGHMPVNSFDEPTEKHKEVLEELEEVAEDSLVAISSQCIHGRINMNVYDTGIKLKDAGVVSSENMVPGVAYVKLMWSIGQAETEQEAEKLFKENIAGEIQSRETVKD
ncbi:MAG: Glu-tRNA(Gln) amidotransferase subunit GatD [Candidatus Nanohaloarchaeota archaeon QJJ-9]|nr:Glu-tRNA(Gln) amidotransferase subunit GatD [Candidatus Nanohaloarchaeota archaeon QJJ-9]